LAIDNVRIARWLESLHVVRVSRLEREEPSPQFTTLHFRDVDGTVHTVSVNPDGSPREYKDPKGHVHQYNTRYRAPVQPAQAVAAAPAVVSSTTAKANSDQGRAQEAPPVAAGRLTAAAQPQQGAARPQTDGPARAPGGPPPQPSRMPVHEARAQASADPPTPAPAKATKPSVVGGEPAVKKERKGLEEVVIEWAGKNQGLNGVSVLRREISTKGITFRLKGPDGAEYEAITGMDQQVKSFRKL